MKSASQKEIWNQIANKWSEYRREPQKEVVDFIKDKDGKILDLGCGSGRHFLKIKGKIYAVDFSDEMIKHAKENAKKIGIKAEFFCNSADKLPFEDNFFDCAIYYAALHCIDSEEKREKSLKELYRVLKPNAKALISVWSKNHDRIKKGQKEQFISWGIDGNKVQRFYYIYDKDELELKLKKIGFKIVSSEEKKNIIIEVKK